jgi:vesicle transport through interaction with t-SNAREs protein 1
VDLDEAEELIAQMEIEIRGMPQSIRPQYTTRMRTCKTEVNRWKTTAKEVHQASARDALLGGKGTGSGGPVSRDDPYGDSEASDRTRLLAGHQSLQDSSRRLQDSQRIALETEELGGDIMRSLRVQREQIEHSRDTLHGAEGNVDRASGTLNKMVGT